MKRRSINQNGGYTKKELIDIIEKIDIDETYLEKKPQMSNTRSETDCSYLAQGAEQTNK